MGLTSQFGRSNRPISIQGTWFNSFTYFAFLKSHPPSPFNWSGLLSSSHNLQMFFQPIRRHFLKTAFNSFKSFASRRSFWADFKSSRDAIAGIFYSLRFFLETNKLIPFKNRPSCGVNFLINTFFHPLTSARGRQSYPLPCLPQAGTRGEGGEFELVLSYQKYRKKSNSIWSFVLFLTRDIGGKGVP